MTFRSLLFMHRHKKACAELQRITDERRNSFEITDYRKRRAAALKVRRS